jgi:hypothetical protein
MPITFHNCHVYNKVFFFESNKLAFYAPIIVSLPVGLVSLLQVLGGCKSELFSQNRLSFIPWLTFFLEVLKVFVKQS